MHLYYYFFLLNIAVLKPPIIIDICLIAWDYCIAQSCKTERILKLVISQKTNLRTWGPQSLAGEENQDDCGLMKQAQLPSSCQEPGNILGSGELASLSLDSHLTIPVIWEHDTWSKEARTLSMTFASLLNVFQNLPSWILDTS